jgi:hypothetical protein
MSHGFTFLLAAFEEIAATPGPFLGRGLERGVHDQGGEETMSGKTGARETGKKPVSTRRHDSLADGAFGHDNPAGIRFGDELNTKITGQPSKQHSKHKGKVQNAVRAGSGKKRAPRPAA